MDDYLTYFRINPYPHYVGFAFNKEMREAILKEAGIEYNEQPSDREYGAVTEFFRDGENAAALCIVSFFGDSEPAHWIMAHEAVHVVSDVWHRCGIRYDCHEDEQYAYLMEWLVRMMTFAYDAHKNTPHENRGFCVTDQIKQRIRNADTAAKAKKEGTDPINFGDPIKEGILKAKGIEEGVEHGYIVKLPDELHPTARKLVLNIAREMSQKLLQAQIKYNRTDDWRNPKFTPAMWTEEFIRQSEQGDHIDMINYLAFAKDRKFPANLVRDGFAAFELKVKNDELCLKELNKADVMLDARRNEDQLSGDIATLRQYESLAVNSSIPLPPPQVVTDKEPCCPNCDSIHIAHTAKSKPQYYCKACSYEFDKYGLKVK